MLSLSAPVWEFRFSEALWLEYFLTIGIWSGGMSTDVPQPSSVVSYIHAVFLLLPGTSSAFRSTLGAGSCLVAAAPSKNVVCCLWSLSSRNEGEVCSRQCGCVTLVYTLVVTSEGPSAGALCWPFLLSAETHSSLKGTAALLFAFSLFVFVGSARTLFFRKSTNLVSGPFCRFSCLCLFVSMSSKHIEIYSYSTFRVKYPLHTF